MRGIIEQADAFYGRLSEAMQAARKRTGKPLTLAEKILFTHLFETKGSETPYGDTGYACFRPDRVAMQDATAQMALLQFVLAGCGRTAIPASVHCDHLVTACRGDEEDLKKAREENMEIYDFLSSACRRYGISFWGPGTGIIHQIVLENYAFPGGMIIGADSHTSNAGGLGMLGIGVGGSDAVDAMAGMPWELKIPRVTGVKLTGRLNGWTSAKDVILKLTGMLTVSGGTGSVIEYFGDGAASIPCTGKATICNMGAETGATSSVFPFDNSMAAFLVSTGRAQIAEMSFAHRENLTADPEVYENPDRYYDRVIEINLSEMEPYINGPYTPDAATPVSAMGRALAESRWPEEIEVVLAGSCTNSSYEDLSAAASVIEDALAKKLKPKARIIISPGSDLVKHLAEKNGLMELFRRAGAQITANACGPCIGQWERETGGNNRANTIVHTFNRNFSRRTDGNPNTHVFVTSPETAVALAFAGRLTFNPAADTLKNEEGDEVLLKEPVRRRMNSGSDLYKHEGVYDGLLADENQEIIVAEGSERLQLLKPFPEWDGKDFHELFLLIRVKGKCTTDHISAAGPWLRYRGHLANISGNYMMGAVNAFNNCENRVLNMISGEYTPVHEAAKAYRDTGTGSLVVAEDNFGEGSSREHAAMEARFLGVKAVVAKSFARIHETNLKKQGVLALTFADKGDYEKIREDDRIDITGLAELAPGSCVRLIIKHSDGTKEEALLRHSYNLIQADWFRAGSALNALRNSNTDKE